MNCIITSDNMNTSSDIIDSAKLETLIIATIQTLKRNNKKCGNDEVFDLVSESLVNQVEREFFDKELEVLIKDQKVKSSFYANRTCLSIPKELQVSMTEKDDLKNDFDNFKNKMINEFDNLKSSFFQEVRSFKNQLLEEHQSNSFHLRSSNDAISPILERLITQLRDEVVTLKNQLDRKDKIIDNLLEKLENKVSKDVTPQCGNSRIKPKLTDKCVNCDLLSTSKEEQTKNNMSNKDSNTISTSTETVRANTVDKEKPSPHMESENPAPTPENNEQNKTNASQITSNQIDENRNQKLKKTAVILGDSMVKHINGWEMAKKVNTDCKVFVKSFSGATTQCMVDYMKPSIRTQPDHFILHVGTNDLTSNTPSDEIARNIINLASEMKSEKSDVSISTIITRADKPELNKKGIEVNNHLKEMCKEKNIFIIDNSKRIKPNHLNSSKIHLNKKGDKILGNIFTQHLSKVFN